MKKRAFVVLIVIVICLVMSFLVKKKETIKMAPTITEESKTTDGEGYIRVYIYGEVLKEGGYLVPINWTLGDLIMLVGLSDDADTKSLDMSLLLVKGCNYYVKKKTSEVHNTISSLININFATLDELKTLEGIGDTLALRIIEYRNINPFETIEDIKKVKGIKDYIYEKIKAKITV